MAGPIAWPRMPRKIPSSWICGCDRSDTLDNETARPGLSKINVIGRTESRPSPGSSISRKSSVSPLSSGTHNQGYRVFCLSHESCKSGEYFPLVGNARFARLDGGVWRSERNRGAARSDRLGGGGWRRVRVRGGRRHLVCRRYCADDSLRFAR